MSSALFQQVVEATRGEYVLHATLGQSDALGTAFLAREVSSGRSVALVVAPDAESLDVVGALSDAIPADAGGCVACGFRVGTWVAQCPGCEHSLLPPPGPSPEAAAIADQLRDSMDVLGSLPHVRGGTVYFGRETSDGRLTAFVVRPQDDGQLALDVVWEVAADAARVAVAPGSTREAEDRAPDAWAVNGAGMHDGTFDQASAPVAERDAAREFASSRGGSRRWLPIGLGVGALALVGAGAFALTRREAPARATVVPADTAIKLNPPIDTSLRTAQQQLAQRQAVAGVTPPDSAGAARVLTPEQQHWRDSVNAVRRHVRDSVRAANAAAAASGVLTIEGDLPNGWSATVNGNGATDARDLQVPASQSVLIRIQAPGYCSDTLRVQLAPQGRQHWSPTLRGRSIVEEC